jgi:opacity protein-like surface antigen
MASLISRARATALSATLGAMCASAATAADMPFLSPLPAPPVEQPVEFGTGWYLRGDVGYSNMSVPVVVADFANNLGRTGAASGNIGFGYQYNEWFRTEFAIDRAVFRPSSARAPQWCPSGKVLYYNQDAGSLSGQAIGYLYDPSETCTPYVTAHLNRTTPMVNAYLDLGHWSGFTPYVGAGIGMTNLQASSAVNYNNTANGGLWEPNLAVQGVPLIWVPATNTYTVSTVNVTSTSTSTVGGVTTTTTTTTPTTVVKANPVTPPRTLQFAQLIPSQYSKKTSWKFSWNIMAGVSYDVSQNVKIDVGYRFLNAGSYTSLPSMLTLAPGVTKELISQEVRVGFRLTSD